MQGILSGVVVDLGGMCSLFGTAVEMKVGRLEGFDFGVEITCMLRFVKAQGLLLTHSIDRSQKSHTALFWAASNFHHGIVALLLEAGSDEDSAAEDMVRKYNQPQSRVVEM